MIAGALLALTLVAPGRFNCAWNQVPRGLPGRRLGIDLLSIR